MDNTDGPPTKRRITIWDSPLARFSMVLLASLALWTAIGFGLWQLVRALS